MTKAALADGVVLDDDAHHAAWEAQLKAAGAGQDDPVKRVEFIRWQVLRAGTPLRLMAQHHATGPIPLATAHAASGLHLLLGVITASQDAVAQGDGRAGRTAGGGPGGAGDCDRRHRHPAEHAQVGRLVGGAGGGDADSRERAAGAGEADGGGRCEEGAEGPAA
ncbi:DUF6245 family protein [Streptomyces sp. NPDC001758]